MASETVIPWNRKDQLSENLSLRNGCHKMHSWLQAQRYRVQDTENSKCAIQTFHHNSTPWISSRVLSSLNFRWRRRHLSVLFFLLTLISFQSNNEVLGYVSNVRNGVCTGTEWGNSRPEKEENTDKHYNSLKERYSNCTYVEGNLEITWLKDKNFDFSFLSNITEVTGYIFVMFVYADVVPLTNLRVIRGKSLYQGNALYVALNYHKVLDDWGLVELQMPKLNEIINGGVYFKNNDRLCYVHTIQWDDLQQDLEPVILTTENHADCKNRTYRCDNSCTSGSCWGAGPDMCQTLTLKNCSKTCDYRCRGTSPADCCHRSCAAGCRDSTQRGCFACRDFTNDEECVSQCPPRYIYNPTTFQEEKNENFKFSYGFRCVDQCPANVIENGDNCVKHCPAGKTELNKKCEECNGPCIAEKVCTIPEGKELLFEGAFLNNSLSNCTKIAGSIIIGTISFDGDLFNGEIGITIENLREFSTVREITGYLSIQATDQDLENISFFRNLEKISGRNLYNYEGFARCSLHITHALPEVLPFTKLQEIAAGDVYIANNDNLCFVSNVNFENIFTGNGQIAHVEINNDKCEQEGKVCHSECLEGQGCWGPLPTHCAKCAHAQFEDTCLPDCSHTDSNTLLYTKNSTQIDGPTICARCHSECRSGCDRPEADHCVAIVDSLKCKNVRDGPFCRAQCPASRYPDENNICQDCDLLCKDGCTGPENTLGTNGCNHCHQALVEIDGTVIRCYPEDDPCPDDFFSDRIPFSESNLLSETMICKKCDPLCEGCIGSGPGWCKACRNYTRGKYCISSCEKGEYADSNNSCKDCHPECDECSGGSNQECIECSSLSIFEEETNTTTCVSDCPVSHPFQTEPRMCVAVCPEGHYARTDKRCNQCHLQCRGGCSDDTSSGCHECRHINQSGACKEKCDNGWVEDENRTCMSKGTTDTRTTNKTPQSLAVIIVAGAVLLIAVIMIICFLIYRVSKQEMVYVDYTSNIPMNNLDEERDPMTPSGVSPNQAILTIIKETHLKRGNVLGSGAFGTVYKGLWIPDGEPKVRIPVAIKILRDVSSQAAEEFLEEAKVMASVDHPCLLRLLCVCMAGEITLITQLMPLGALLDYIRQHKEKIGSHHLLRWSHQIAEGMVYLEEKHLIHRDLAARNVLVQTPGQVKITDFGLAKFLNVDENVYKAQGGKMPIKWLALESIQYRRFSHKSDVWSFGVTLWEIMTFGGKPYDGVKARDVPELLVKGERLQQPPICTIDVYMLMVKCWLEDENSRPSFQQLSDELMNMLQDPQRYLVVQHDSESDALPSPNPSDFYKSLISEGMEGAAPELLMDADEYLQPMGQMKENYTYQPSQGFAFPQNNPPPAAAITAASPFLPASPGANGIPGRNSRKDSTLTRYSQDPIVAKQQYESQRSNGSAEASCAEPEYQNDPMQPMLPRQDVYIPLADDANKGIAVDNLEYLAVLGSEPMQEDVWSPRKTNNVGSNGTIPYKNGMTDNLSNSTPFLHNPKSPVSQDPEFQRLYSTPASVTPPEHDYINNQVQVGGGESTV
ncbi:epidermal growth factor receptor-like isoform X3 [Apostichopus japonicus]|uniref:epidermal growth factor receptor-like isoform X3 n=1 Tax=Stichopus japonicus TaxID=307972 RepID=UPI003AB34C4D